MLPARGPARHPAGHSLSERLIQREIIYRILGTMRARLGRLQRWETEPTGRQKRFVGQANYAKAATE